jgi:hypothetical protein
MDVKGIQKGVIERGSADFQNRSIPLQQKDVDLATRSFHVIGSTINIDRHGEVILPSAYKATLAKFLASNAPLSSQHLRQTATGAPTQVGWVMTGDIQDEAVDFGCCMAKTVNGEEFWLLVSDPNGKGVAASVGFMPEEWMAATAKELCRELPELTKVFARAKIPDNQYVRVYTKVELYHLAIVENPSNRESIQVMRALGVESAEAFKTLLTEAISAPLSAAAAKISIEPIIERLDAIESKMGEVSLLLCRLAPDTVNPRSEAPAAPDAEDEEDAGAKADGAGLKSAAESLRRACAT